MPQTANEHYEVLVEDSSFANSYNAEPMPVAQRYVIAYKTTKKIRCATDKVISI